MLGWPLSALWENMESASEEMRGDVHQAREQVQTPRHAGS